MSNLSVVKPASVDGPSNIPTRLRAYADEIERGETAPRTVLIVSDLEDKGVDLYCIGYRPRRAQAMGLLAYAQNMAYENRDE